IIDTLPPYVDPATVQMVGAFHYPYEFNISGSGILTWRFDPYSLPDSASDPAGSQGYVSFAVKLKPNLPTGTIISNTAHIYFDYNEAVVTNTVVNNIDLCLGLTSSITVSATIQQGNVYTLPDGSNTGISGTYTNTLQASNGCDSVITTNLSVT